MNKEIFMALDLGTESTGWAVTTNDYKIYKKNGKSFWGVYMFDEAKTQQERRTYRSNSRRINRRKQRIVLLQDLLFDEISKVDSNFFVKLNSSFCKLEDRDSKVKYNLFNDFHFSDVDYYNLYPTIYHLRKYLLETNEKADIRLIYLALHHMLKYRGNFNFSGQKFDVNNLDLLSIFDELNYLIDDELEKFDLSNVSNLNIFSAFLNNKGILKTKEALNTLLGVKKQKHLIAIVSLISGGSVKISDIYSNDEYIEIGKISFSDLKYEELIVSIESSLGDDVELIYKAKNIYDTVVLKRLLGDNKYLSNAMVDKYNKHANDLAALKSYVLSNNKKLYNDIFRNANVENNYPNYIGSNIVGNSKDTLKHCKVADFYSFLKKKLEITPKTNEYFDSILLDMERNNYLPRLNSTSNGVFPYQLNEIEMETILNNQSKHYPFLLDKDAYGTVIDKILSILTFKIPYYVGPLNKSSKLAWLERKNEKIYPWNFEDIVDIDKSAYNFIDRMKNKCTYLYDETTLPKNSLVYSMYEVLNEINKLNINGKPITSEDKKSLINNVFLKNKKVSIKQINIFFKSLYGTSIEITTSNDKPLEEIKSNLGSWIIFMKIFKDDFNKKIDIIESIIEEITIFEDKNILYKRLIEVYKLPLDICKIIKGISFKGYGKFSKKLLIDIKTEIVDEYGEVHEKNIMDILEETNLNFMEIIYSSKYTFNNYLQDYNINVEKVNYELINSLPTSPAVKRGVWNAIKLVDEVEEIIGKKIDKFFIECTRGNGIKGDVKSSRKRDLLSKYKAVNSVLREYDLLNKNEMNELYSSLDSYDERALRSKKLFLYFSQLGKCMYSNEPIDIRRLLTDDYDIDHIIPRSITKDDGFDNLVLVKSQLNREKGSDYPIKKGLVNPEAITMWKILKDNNLISDNKYGRLTRKNELTSDEMVQFINRQIVFTNQTVKIVANILKSRNENCEIVWSKASNVSDFRNKFDIPKSREVNDFHHAHDAYINIVVGNVFNSKFGYEMNVKKYNEFKEKGISLKNDKIYDYPIKYKNDLYAWIPNKTIVDVKKELSKVEMLISYMMTKNKGAFYKATIYAPSENKVLIPLKSKGPLSDYKKYGGYDNMEFSHFAIVKHIKKGKEQYLFVGIPVIISNESNEKLLDYIIDKYEVTNPEIVLNNIRKNMIISVNGFEYRIRGEKDRVVNHQSYWNCEQTNYIKQLLKASELNIDRDLEELIIHKSIDKTYVVSKKLNCELYDQIIKKYSNSLFQKSSLFVNLVSILCENKQKFEELTLKEQCIVLKNIMTIQVCKPSRSDLSLIGGSKDFGRVTLNTNLQPGTKIITKSITGYYSKVLFEIK